MDKKIIFTTFVLATLLLSPIVAVAQSSGNINLEEEIAFISVPSWLKASMVGPNSIAKYKAVLTNTGELSITPDLAVHAFKIGIACPSSNTNLNDWLTTHVGDINNDWQVRIRDNGNILEDWRAGGNSRSTGTVISKGASVTWYVEIKIPQLTALGTYCVVAEFKDTTTGVLLDWKADDIVVTSPKGELTFTFLSYALILSSIVLITKGAGLW